MARNIIKEMHDAHAIRYSIGCAYCDKILNKESNEAMRKFESGATRDTDAGKIDYQGFLSHEVLKEYGEYMLRHQKQADGQLRASDNWKKGIPRDAYIKSMFRHMMEVVALHEEEQTTLADTVSPAGDFQSKMDEALYALMFNVMGYAYERTQGR